MAVKVTFNEDTTDKIGRMSVVNSKNSTCIVVQNTQLKYMILNVENGILFGGLHDDLERFIEEYELELITNDIELILNNAKIKKDI